jgi:hypothetical protein
MNIVYRVELSQGERAYLKALLSSGKHAVRKIKRAQILLAADAAPGMGGMGEMDIQKSIWFTNNERSPPLPLIFALTVPSGRDSWPKSLTSVITVTSFWLIPDNISFKRRNNVCRDERNVTPPSDNQPVRHPSPPSGHRNCRTLHFVADRPLHSWPIGTRRLNTPPSH